MIATITIERNGKPWQVDCVAVWVPHAYGRAGGWQVDRAYSTDLEEPVYWLLTAAEECLACDKFQARYEEQQEVGY